MEIYEIYRHGLQALSETKTFFHLCLTRDPDGSFLRRGQRLILLKLFLSEMYLILSLSLKPRDQIKGRHLGVASGKNLVVA